MPTQTLASGKIPAKDQYGKFGIRDHDEVVSPRFMFGVIVGEGGCGKTTLFLDHPGALIINTDLHSIPKDTPDAKAACAFWPVINKKGQCIDEDGKPFRLSWNSICALKDRLLKAAANDQPRPETIVLDTLPPTVMMARHSYALSKGYTDWDSMPGGNFTRKAYGVVYDGYIDFVQDLRYAGYGVFIIAHLLTQYFETDEGMKIQVSHNIPDKIFLRLFPTIEFLGAVELQFEKVYDKKPDGTTQFDKFKRVPHRYLVNMTDKMKNKDQPGMTRARVALPEKIEIKPGSGWASFEKAYMIAAGSK